MNRECVFVIAPLSFAFSLPSTHAHSGSTLMVHSAVRPKRCLTTTSVFAWREESESRRSPAYCTLCCELLFSTETTGSSLCLFGFVQCSVFLFSAPCAVTAGRASGCGGSILSGSAGSFSPCTGLRSCCAPCTTRSGQRLPAAVFFLHSHVGT